MTTNDEERLRRLLDALTPEAPLSVTDPRPVVRRARQRRRAAGAALGAAALVAVAVAVPAWLNRPGDDGGVASGVEQGPDPFTALPCRDLPTSVADGFDPRSVTAARMCVAGDDLGFTFATPPADALVSGLDSWANELESLPAADPARCAAVDVMPTPVRLLVEQSDGTRLLVDPNLCADVRIGTTTVDGGDTGDAFLRALAAQRAILPPPEQPVAAGLDCSAAPTMTVPVPRPAPPTAAWECFVNGTRGRDHVLTETTEITLSAVAAGVSEAESRAVYPYCGTVRAQLVTIDAYGDVVRWDSLCDELQWVMADRAPDLAWYFTVPSG